MPVTRISRRDPSSQRAAAGLDAHFPRAVRGEDYSRYVAAMWGQAVRWLRRELFRATDDFTQDAYAALHAAAEECVERDLYPQEKQLLSELVQREWDTIVEERERASPEVPAFLRRPN